jgi:ABC-type branched-subunit amino acid transport system substrate-binding protein
MTIMGQHTRRKSAIAVMITVGVIFAAAACSSSSSPPKASTSSPRATSTTTTVRIGIISPSGTALQNDPEAVAAVEAAALGLNKTGGIDGHQVAIDSCNPEADPNTSLACARQMISDNVIGTVRDFVDADNGQVTSILAAAGIPEVFSDPQVPSQYSATNFYPIDGGSAFQIAASLAATKAAGIQKIAVAATDVPGTAPIVSLVNRAAPGTGTKVATVVEMSTTAVDFSAYAAKIVESGAKAVLLAANATQSTSLMQAVSQAGGSGIQFYTAYATFTEADLAQFSPAVQSVLHIVSPVPPVSAASSYPMLAAFESDMEAEQAKGNSYAASSYWDPQAVTAWLGVQAIAQIMKGSSNLTSGGLTAALKGAKNVDLGLIPPWTPSSPGPTGYPRVSNLYEYFLNVSGGDLVLPNGGKAVNVGPTLGLG